LITVEEIVLMAFDLGISGSHSKSKLDFMDVDLDSDHYSISGSKEDTESALQFEGLRWIKERHGHLDAHMRQAPLHKSEFYSDSNQGLSETNVSSESVHTPCQSHYASSTKGWV
jgi:hypothetical protein